VDVNHTSSTNDLPGWVPGAVAAAGIIGAFSFCMWLLGRVPKSFGDLKELTSRYNHVLGVSQEPSGMVLIRFIDKSGKEQIHDWYFDGKDWRCGLTGELQ
jgi:hypothetical protein